MHDLPQMFVGEHGLVLFFPFIGCDHQSAFEFLGIPMRRDRIVPVRVFPPHGRAIAFLAIRGVTMTGLPCLLMRNFKARIMALFRRILEGGIFMIGRNVRC